MTARGRLTIAVTVVALVGLAAGFVSVGLVSPRRVSLSGVASSPPAPEPNLAPAELARMLPTTPAQTEAANPADDSSDPGAPRRLAEWLKFENGENPGPYRIEYTMDAELTERITALLRRSRVRRGHVVVMDPRNGRILAYVSSEDASFPPTGAYPAASLVKIVTAAAALESAPELARKPCRYNGSPYRLRGLRWLRPRGKANEASLERALATSNNQCFAQLAVNALGGEAMAEAFDRFGWLEPPAPGHSAGSFDRGEGDYDLGRLGSGLAGSRITPLHAAQLIATLAKGTLLQPWWIDRVLDTDGDSLALPPRRPHARAMSEDVANELRGMLVATTQRGTARSAFRDRRRRPKLGNVKVAGKTGNLSGHSPKGRYEWFAGLAPAEDPTIAIAVVQLHDDLWWAKSSEVAADVLKLIFCEGRNCSAARARRVTGDLGRAVAPIFLSGSGS